MFCLECGAQMERSDRFAIERKIQKAHCHSCGTFNPIEVAQCENCGQDLSTNHGAAIRDEHGRLRLVRESALSTRDKVVHGLVSLVLFGALIRVGVHAWSQAGGDTQALTRMPLAYAAGVPLTIGLFSFLNPNARLDYKTRALFALILCSAHVLPFAAGTMDLALWEGFNADLALLWIHNLAMAYCLFFLVVSQFLGSVFTAGACLVGLWCAYASLVVLFQGGGFSSFLGTLGSFGALPVFLTPGFLTFNVFLPYVLLQMLGHLFHQVAQTRQFVSSSETDRAVIREVRRRNLQGVILNLFVAGVSLAVGLLHMHNLGKPNLLSPLVDLTRPLFALVRS